MKTNGGRYLFAVFVVVVFSGCGDRAGLQKALEERAAAEKNAEEQRAVAMRVTAEIARLEVQVREARAIAQKALAQRGGAVAAGNANKPEDQRSNKTGGLVTFKDGKTRPFEALSGAEYVSSDLGVDRVSRMIPVPNQLVLYRPRKSSGPLFIAVEKIGSISIERQMKKAAKGNSEDVYKVDLSSRDGKKETIEVWPPFYLVIHWADSTIAESFLNDSLLGMKITFNQSSKKGE